MDSRVDKLKRDLAKGKLLDCIIGENVYAYRNLFAGMPTHYKCSARCQLQGRP